MKTIWFFAAVIILVSSAVYAEDSLLILAMKKSPDKTEVVVSIQDARAQGIMPFGWKDGISISDANFSINKDFSGDTLISLGPTFSWDKDAPKMIDAIFYKKNRWLNDAGSKLSGISGRTLYIGPQNSLASISLITITPDFVYTGKPKTKIIGGLMLMLKFKGL